MKTMRFRSFRSRLVVVFLGLFVVIQATGYVAVAAFVRTSARQHVEEELRLATTLFARQLDERGRQLVAATRLLSGDFAPAHRDNLASRAARPCAASSIGATPSARRPVRWYATPSAPAKSGRNTGTSLVRQSSSRVPRTCAASSLVRAGGCSST